jgi:uncharacterized protein
MSESKNRKANRLLNEKSPYLLQHAYNPVNWYPWGDEAFTKARTEDKPIFVSIGYSTCHWCHVMERESFESDTVAEFLNEHFVSIKIDREERPDIDAIYMAAVQAMSGSGGWPMTVFLTPNLKPFFGGTYFPPKPAYGRPSFLRLLSRISELWQNEREKLVESSEVLTAHIGQENKEAGAETPDADELLDHTFAYFLKVFDKEEGGFGSAPKFPRPVQFDFLFNRFAQTGEPEARDMALFTLRKMANGGMHDHLAGGFHRYSVDPLWRVSHFEKMLYDQAQLVHSYLDAWQITHDDSYVDVARDIVEYVLRDMTHEGGAFFSAEDADSEGEEGTFYVWTAAELRELLADDAECFIHYFGVTDEGNFEHGKNVLYKAHTFAETATHCGVESWDVRGSLEAAKKKVFEVRSKRVRPGLDDKILTSWNGLMIGAIARAGGVMLFPPFVHAAERAAEFIWQNLRVNDRLLHRWRDGEARFDAYLDTYAFLIKGYIELYEATLNAVWIERALILQREQDDALYDSTNGGYFMSREASDVLVRSKNDYDGAEPSGNSISVLNLLKLAAMTGKSRYREKAEKTIQHFTSRSQQHPYAMPLMMVGLDWSRRSFMQVVLAGEVGDEELHAMKDEVYLQYLPQKVVFHNDAILERENEFIRELQPIDGMATAYVCQNFTCELPVNTSGKLRLLLESKSTVAQ